MSVNEMQFGFMFENGPVDAVFIATSLLEGYHAKEKSCIWVLWVIRNLLTEYHGKFWNG